MSSLVKRGRDKVIISSSDSPHVRLHWRPQDRIIKPSAERKVLNQPLYTAVRKTIQWYDNLTQLHWLGFQNPFVLQWKKPHSISGIELDDMVIIFILLETFSVYTVENYSSLASELTIKVSEYETDILVLFSKGDSNSQKWMDSGHENSHAHSLWEGPETHISSRKWTETQRAAGRSV